MIIRDLSTNGVRNELGGIEPFNLRHTRDMAHRSTQLNSYSRAKDSSLWSPAMHALTTCMNGSPDPRKCRVTLWRMCPGNSVGIIYGGVTKRAKSLCRA